MTDSVSGFVLPVISLPASQGAEGPQTFFRGRVLLFDERAALVWARIMSEGTSVGRPRSAVDMVVAAIAEANDCVVITGNEKHFPGVRLFNPLRKIATQGIGRALKALF